MKRQGEGEGEAEKGGDVMLHTDRGLLASHMITHTLAHMHTGRYTYNYMYTLTTEKSF